MKATLKAIRTLFDKYNSLCFGDALPSPKLGLEETYGIFGELIVRYDKKRHVKWVKICVSTYFDFTEDELRDIIVHEMIHYYLFANGCAKWFKHGKEFKAMANDFNSKYQMNIKSKSSVGRYKRAKDAPLGEWVAARIMECLFFWKI